MKPGRRRFSEPVPAYSPVASPIIYVLQLFIVVSDDASSKPFSTTAYSLPASFFEPAGVQMDASLLATHFFSSFLACDLIRDLAWKK